MSSTLLLQLVAHLLIKYEEENDNTALNKETDFPSGWIDDDIARVKNAFQEDEETELYYRKQLVPWLIKRLQRYNNLGW